MTTAGDTTDSGGPGSFLRSHQLFDWLAEGIVVHAADGSVIDANEPACRLLGLTREQLMGRTSLDPAWGAVHEDGSPFPGVEHPAMVTLATGQELSDVVLGIDAPGLGRRWLSVSSRLLDPERTPRRVAATFVDVTDRVVAAQELAASQDRYRLLAEHASDVVYRLDVDDRFSWVTPAVQSELGWRPEQMIGRPLSDFLRPAGLQAVAAARSPGAVTVMGELEFLRADGTYQWFSGRATVIRDASGRVVGRIVGLRDISEQVAARDALARSEQHYRRLAENASDAVLESDRVGVVQWVSPSIQRLLGWRATEVVGRPLVDLALPADRKQLEILGRLLDSGVPLGEVEFRAMTSDGGSRWVSLHSTPIRDGDRNVTGMVVGLHDVDERVRAREALAAGERRYRLLAENANDVVLEVDRSGQLVWISRSAERVLGWRPAEILGVPVHELVVPEERAAAIERRNRAVAGATLDDIELRFRTASGGTRWMSSHTRSIVDDAGEVTGLIAGLRDCQAEVTARRALTTLSAGSGVLVRSRDEQELLTGMCEVAVERGGYLLAWYGRPQHDEARSILPVAASAERRGYVEEIEVSWADVPTGRGPTGISIREARTVVIDDFFETPMFEPWRATASRYGLRSSVSLPVFVDGMIDGTFTVYAAEPHAFDGAAVALLEDLASEIGAGLERLATERRYRLLAENSSDVVAFLGDAGQVEWVSPSVHERFGRRPEELIGANMMDFVDPADLARAAELFGRALQDTLPATEIRGLLPDGSTRWLSVVGRPVTLGGVNGLVVGIRDVDDAVRARNALADQQQRDRAILDTLLDPHLLLRPIRSSSGRIDDFEILEANAAACDYLGRGRASVVGARLLELLPALDTNGMLERYVHTIETGEPIVLDEFAYLSEVHGATRWFDIRGVRVGTDMSYAWRDVTERVMAALHLAESERNLRELHDQLDDLLAHGSALAVRADPSGILTWVSGSSSPLLGIDPAVSAGTSVVDWVHPDDVPALLEVMQALADGETNQPLHVRLRAADGTYRWFEGLGFTGRDADSDEVVLEATLFDVTEREAVARLREQVVAVASHELRTPLAFIHGSLRLFEAGMVKPDDERGRELLSRVTAASERLARIADSLLRLQRLELADNPTVTSPVDVVHCVEEAIATVPTVRGVEIALHDLTAGGLELFVDADQLTQAVVNLVGNAVKHAPDGTPVEVTVEPIERGVRVAVRDHGPGVPAEHRKAVFRPFHQVEASDRATGAGLGLAIVARIVELHHGTAVVESPEDGTGARFVIELHEVAEHPR